MGVHVVFYALGWTICLLFPFYLFIHCNIQYLGKFSFDLFYLVKRFLSVSFNIIIFAQMSILGLISFECLCFFVFFFPDKHFLTYVLLVYEKSAV